MVTKWGLSEDLGPLLYDEDEGEPFLGMSAGTKALSVSNQTAAKIDAEVRSIIDECYATAEKILHDNLDKLHAMADALVEYETLNATQLDDIMAGAKPRAPEDSGGDFGGGDASGDTRGDTQGEKGKPESGPGPIGGPAEET